VDYTRDIKPILRQHCVACHGAKVTKSKLRLDTAALALKGGSSGPAIVPGKASESLLIDAVKGNGMERMPLKASALNARQIELLGLPPTAQEVDAFLADAAPDAYERLVDRLLASPHYGERWGRHWLDQARYADTHGFTIDAPREIWKYRDWVIDALNRDLR